jgi:dienelactone hydrolase
MMGRPCARSQLCYRRGVRARSPFATAATAGAAAVSLLCFAGACTTAPAPKPTPAVVDEDAPAPAPFAQMRARATHLLRHGPAPDSAPPVALPDVLPVDARWEIASVPAGDHTVQAVIARPLAAPRGPDDEVDKLPAVVIFHGGFHLAADQLAWAAPFIDAGFVVLFPTLRGENGNGGDYELLYGELDDGKAAARFLAQEPDVDVDHLYAVGHSVGGGLCALLAVDGESPFRILGSIGGAYAAGSFSAWPATLVPFDVHDVTERQLRALTPFVEQLRTPLVLYTGQADAPPRAVLKVVAPRAQKAGVALTVVDVPGDHLGSVQPALAHFAALISADVHKSAGPPAVALR